MRNIWIFTVSEELSSAQDSTIKIALNAFLTRWQAHGEPVEGEAEILHKRFIVIKAVPNQASGCSIDSMRAEVVAIVQASDVELLESNMIGLQNDEGEIHMYDFREIEAAIAKGEITMTTKFYDTAVSNREEYSTWIKPVSQSWLSRYFQNTTV